MGNFRELGEQFNSRQVAGDPWSHVDAFGRTTILKTLTTTFKGLKSTPVKAVTVRSRASSVSSAVCRIVLQGSGKAQKLAFFGDIPSSEVSRAVEDLRESSSKD